MCGICGWLNLKRKLDSHIILKMNNIAKYRGPDDEGYISIAKGKRHSLSGMDSCKLIEYDSKIQEYVPEHNDDFLFLGHRRLSIIDLSPAGHQPMSDTSNCISITFNGEIYNYEELRAELKKKGHIFDTETDTEVILKSYVEWGEECVSHFNGMWGFAIWDEKNNKLFCSRDRLGAKPFYYSISDDEFIFSSEIKQLCQNPNIKRVLNESIAVTQIMWGISDFSEDTLIKDIKMLPGGYNIVIQLDDKCQKIKEINKYQYWDIDVSRKDIVDDNSIFEVLEDAIHLRTRSDAPIGVMLSGGLDSSCIVAEIAEYYDKQGKERKELHTYTSCYENFKEGDEAKFAEIVNKHCGVSQNLIFPDAQDTLKEYEEMIWHTEGSVGLGALGSYLLLQEIAQTGTKVLINGQGADETQFGYERYYAWYFKDILKSGRIIAMVSAFKDGKHNSRLSAKMLIQYYFYFSFFTIRKRYCLKRMKPYITDVVREEFNTNSKIKKYIKQSNMEELQYNEIRNTQLTHILRMDDRLYMSQSMESRVPFIDYRYVEKAVRVPEERKIQKGFTKYLLRKHYESKLPEDIIWRKNKMGWPSPKERWANKFDDQRIYQIFVTAKTRKFFDVDKLDKLYKKNPSSYPIEQFLSLEFFVRNFDVSIE